MKTEKIGNLEIEICENINDLPITRFVALKEYIIYAETNVSALD